MLNKLRRVLFKKEPVFPYEKDKEVIIYLLKNCLNNSLGMIMYEQLEELVYLVDWKNCLERGFPMTHFTWFVKFDGPYMELSDSINKRVYKLLEEDNDIITDRSHIYSENKIKIGIDKKYEYSTITMKDKEVLDHVVKFYDKYHGNPRVLHHIVTSTFPIIHIQPKGSNDHIYIDMVQNCYDYRDTLPID